MEDRSYGKINLCLDCSGIRDNGYHELSTIMLPISFYDDLSIEIANQTSFSCNKYYIRYNESNTIYKMIKEVKDRYDIHDEYKIVLNKRIPTQAGLAGGSANAASVLRILIKMYNLNPTEDEIVDICRKVGSDVLFNYYNKPALIGGIGDEIKFIQVKKNYSVLLVKPNSGVSTKEAYDKLDINKCDHPDTIMIEELLKTGGDFVPYLANSLEQPAMELNDDIKATKELMLDCGARFALMSGSGSTVFTMSENEKEIDALYEKLKNRNFFVRRCWIHR